MKRKILIPALFAFLCASVGVAISLHGELPGGIFGAGTNASPLVADSGADFGQLVAANATGGKPGRGYTIELASAAGKPVASGVQGLPSAIDSKVSATQLLDIIAASKGKVVMINFFAAFCPPCRLEIPGLINIRERIPEDDLVIIGIALDEDLREMREFVSATAFNYPTYLGGRDVSYAFRASAIPYNIVYDRQGKIVVNEAGYVQEGQLMRFLKQLIDQ